MVEPGIEPGTSWSVARNWPLGWSDQSWSANDLPRKQSKILMSIQWKSTVEYSFKTHDFAVHSENTDCYIGNMAEACRSTDPVTGTDLLQPEAGCPSVHSRHQQ
jgi:hypothetical protein